MNQKAVVKVMNFHALLRVDNARKKAEKYLNLEKEVSIIIDVIANNRNFILDKNLLLIDETKPALNIYFGSDYGFCGGINSQVNKILAGDKDGLKILIGRKLHTPKEGVIMEISRDDYTSYYGAIREHISEALKNKSYSSINVIYNHFNNTSSIELKQKQIFPFEVEREEAYKEDYYVEGDVNRILQNLIESYINYEVKIAAVHSFASENIMRQNSTSESLTRIEEREEEAWKEERKGKTQKEFAKVIDSYVKKKGLKGDRRCE